MNKAHTIFIVTGLVLALAATKILAGVGDVQLTQAGAEPDLVEMATFSPRGYCKHTGGVVTETNKQSVYLCCYQAKAKCVVTDLDKSVSWPIPYGEYSGDTSRLSFKYPE